MEYPPSYYGRENPYWPPDRAERARRRCDSRYGSPCVGADYTADEIEFMMAMDAYKRHHHRPYPDCRDVLRVIRDLGYVKT